MADPPWRFETYSEAGNEKGAGGQYKTMSLKEIQDMPVGHIASRDCLLWLWATHPMLEHQFSVVRAWGFKPIANGVWRKVTKNQKMRWGKGYRLRSVTEPFILGIMGDVPTPRDIPTCFDGLAREHSRKPEEAYALIDHMISLFPNPFPNDNRLDLFSRQERPGWDSHGDEVGKFT